MRTEKRAIRRIPGYCALCISRCGSIAVVENGRFVALEPDPSHQPARRSAPRAAPALVYHPDRLLSPLRRTRPKGDPDPGWQRISWDEALMRQIRDLRYFLPKTCPHEEGRGLADVGGQVRTRPDLSGAHRNQLLEEEPQSSLHRRGDALLRVVEKLRGNLLDRIIFRPLHVADGAGLGRVRGKQGVAAVSERQRDVRLRVRRHVLKAGEVEPLHHEDPIRRERDGRHLEELLQDVGRELARHVCGEHEVGPVLSHEL